VQSIFRIVPIELPIAVHSKSAASPYLLVCLALLALVSFAQGDAPQIATQQAQRTAQQQAVLSGQQATEQVLRQAQQIQ
jgi:hypothetical protein